MQFVRLEGGLTLGGQVVSDILVYTPGYNLSYTYSVKSGENSGLGFGLGYIHFEDESFIPIFFDFTGFTGKKKRGSFINFQAGYAFGFSELYNSYQYYNYRGGICFGIGLGKKFKFSDSFSALIAVAYHHQFANVTYSYDGIRNIESSLNYEMLRISFGIMLDQK
jgi:hypothetical protein